MKLQNKISLDELKEIQKESESQERPEQKTVTSVSSKLRRKLNNLPDPTNPPLGYDPHKAFDRIFPYVNVPALHPKNHGDTVIFNDSNTPVNKLYLGDNLEVLRTLPSNFIDLIYIDPPFFSGRNYNIIWGDSNEVRTFEDIWEGGITSYLIWLNARLWEMRRVLKNDGSIYVHCDWHASHYIKTEMDKIFGYENLKNEIIWIYTGPGSPGMKQFNRQHQTILWYSKGSSWTFNSSAIRVAHSAKTKQNFKQGLVGSGFIADTYELDSGGKVPESWWEYAIAQRYPKGSLRHVGYPTEKPLDLLERIILASSNKGQVVADFFCGGGTTLVAALKNKRKFLGCDSSRVAVSVSLDRLIKLGEEMSGVKSNITTDNKPLQLGLQAEGISEKVPNIEVNYLGVYPVDKFENLEQEEFIDFVLTAYGASRNTGEGLTHGYKPPAQQEPIYIGPANPNGSIEPKEVKSFFEEIKNKVQANQMTRAKIIAWRFSRQTLVYIKTLQNYCVKYNLPIEIEAIPLDSKAFRQRILQRMPGVEDAELFLRFSKPPVIGEIKFKKIGLLEYEFEAVDAISTNEDGWLVNAQWDFDYQEGHFAADKEYILSREKKKDVKKGEYFEAILKAKHKFEKAREYTVACKIQDNLAGETILSKVINVE